MFSSHPHTRPMENDRDYYRNEAESDFASRLHRAMLERGVIIAPTCTGFMSTVMGDTEAGLFPDAVASALE
ncbi:MAG: hypothetical protein ACFHX7_01360 [Pseudomonadota bacterium]